MQRKDVPLTTKWAGNFGIPHDEFVIDSAAKSLEQLHAEGNRAFDAHGIALFKNTGRTHPDDMAELARLVLKSEMRYEGWSNPRANIKEAASNVYEVGAPLVASLPYHHEMAYIGESTTSLSFMSIKSPGPKGATYVSNSVLATDAILATEFGRKLKEHGVCYHRDLTDARDFENQLEIGVYNHWQTSFGTSCPEEAERMARKKGLHVSWDGTKMLTRYYQRAFEFNEHTGRNLLYSSLADDGHWFDEWPLVQHLEYSERPLRMTFGNGEPFSNAERQTFLSVYDEFGQAIDWEVGDVAIICNYRMAHGRPAIHLAEHEERQLGVLLGPMYTRFGEHPDKWH